MPEQIPTYNLKAVIRETGLNAETIRAWERRYGLPKPQRTAGGHRVYSWHDIQLIKWLTERQQEGLSISRAIELWRSLESTGQDPLRAMSGGQTAPGSVSSLGDLRKAWVSACLAFSEQAAEQALAQAFAIASPERVCIDILQAGLSEIGQQWYEGAISVQQEHFASALAMRRLHSLMAATAQPSRPGRLLAACPPYEEHEFGLLLAAYLLRRNGWDVVYLGANVPLLRLEATLKATRPALVISLAQTLPAVASLHEMSLFLHEQNVPLAYGGQAFTVYPSLQERIAGHFLGREIASTPLVVESILTGRQEMSLAAPIDPGYRNALRAYLEKQPQIESQVAACIGPLDIQPAHLDVANQALARHLAAALALGDTGLLGRSLDWVRGLVENAGLPASMVDRYVDLYMQALKEQLDGQGGELEVWLEDFQESDKA